jgi:Na+-transporting NADH:ubiquinone oxidoreductase subunit NqrD
MFGSSGAHELGYAANAILIALLRELVAAGALTQDQVTNLLNHATSTLRPQEFVGSVAGAMRIVGEVKNRAAA